MDVFQQAGGHQTQAQIPEEDCFDGSEKEGCGVLLYSWE